MANKWVAENKDKLTISESFTWTEDNLAVLAVAEEYDIQSETVAQDIITVRGMLSTRWRQTNSLPIFFDEFGNKFQRNHNKIQRVK
jgi:hypothetical protein